MNYVIFLKLCDWMQFEVNCAKSHHHVVSDGLMYVGFDNRRSYLIWPLSRASGRVQEKMENSAENFAK